MQIDPSRRGQMPPVSAPVPVRFSAASIEGWKLVIPGGHPLATPAVVDGRVFIGGGFGSYEFYAFDSVTGGLDWRYQTQDDGPTGAVVAEERVVFNTESCELEVLTTAGERVWKKWLGDPLLSMPAMSADRVFMAYPDTRGDRHHYLACFDLADGHDIWRQPIPGELITCPVLADGKVYVSNLDGTLACFRQEDGHPEWREEKNATSSPSVWASECFFSQRTEHTTGPRSERRQHEQMASKVSMVGTPSVAFMGTQSSADYLDHDRRSAGSVRYKLSAGYDSHVGFGGHKGDSKIEQAQMNLGLGHVSAVWAYQGSRPFVSRGKLYSSIGDTVHCADPRTKEVFWKQKVREGETELLDTYLTPPAAVNGKLFLGTLEGRVLCLCAASGKTLWSVDIGEPVLFQPAVVGGRVYVPTNVGTLYCLETGDPADDGWHMWGGTPAHNGVESDAAVVV